jgi:hypothetical protein
LLKSVIPEASLGLGLCFKYSPKNEKVEHIKMKAEIKPMLTLAFLSFDEAYSTLTADL